MLVFRSAALLIALIMMSAPRPAVGQAQSQPAAIAPEHQDMAAKRAKEKEKINDCHRQATEQKILPRDRPQFVINCLDGTAERNQPSVIAPEYQELAAKRAREKERVDGCQKQATEQKVLPRDRPQFVIQRPEQIVHPNGRRKPNGLIGKILFKKYSIPPFNLLCPNFGFPLARP